MTFLSAYEDFVERTLAALPGWWRKLDYLAGLRRADGRYAHWGLQRVYGERRAQEAMAQAHRELMLQVLRTPLRALVDEVEGGGKEALEFLRQSGVDLLPGDLGGGSARHFSSVVSAISQVAHRRSQATSPSA